MGFFTGDRLNSAFETVQSNRIGQKGSFNWAVATTRKILSPASVLSFLYPASKPTDCFHRPISSLKGGESECIEAKGMRIGQRAIMLLGSVSKLKSLSRLLLVENSIPFLADQPSLITFLLRVCYFIDMMTMTTMKRCTRKEKLVGKEGIKASLDRDGIVNAFIDEKWFRERFLTQRDRIISRM